MYILGITSGGESGAALFENERLICAVNEERLTRKKRDDSYPFNSIKWCIEKAGFRYDQIALICYGFSNGVRQGTFLTNLFDKAITSAHGTEASKIIRERLISENEIDSKKRHDCYTRTRELFPNTQIYWCYHHAAHSANAFVSSPFDNALVITADGRGDFQSLTISDASREEIKEIFCQYSWESIGYFYGRITYLCGFKPNNHEGKITGLAAKGNPYKALGFINKIVSMENGAIKFHLGDYYRPFFSNYSKTIIEEAALYSKEDLAAAAQYQLEKIICSLISEYINKTGLNSICLSGGVFSNVKLNQRIREMDEVSDVFIYPNMSDAGLCTGAVYSWFMHKKYKFVPSPHSLYVGPEIDPEEAAILLRDNGITVRKTSNLIDDVISMIADKKIIGLIQGKTEFGPRALGNRSILSTTAYPELTDIINKRLNRDNFMPFAPAIAAELAPRCLKRYSLNTLSNRHMTLSFDATEEFCTNSPAVVHVDNTTRAQIVWPEDNKFLHQLLIRWYEKTGGLSLLNTSFNMHEDPIISTIRDVQGIIDNKMVDALVFPPYIAIIN